MPRLLVCSSCARHVLASERECPFCRAQIGFGPAAITTAPLWGVALLGLSLVVGTTACTGTSKPGDTPKDTNKATNKSTDKATDKNKPVESTTAVEPTTAAPEPGPEPAPPLPATVTGETGDDAGEISSGTDEGAAIDEPVEPVEPVVEAPRHPNKYGAPPRPAMKYGAPPDPDFF